LKLKLDLHTHCYEATLSSSIETVKEIINVTKSRGLDGIAITEHGDYNYGYQIKKITEQYFNNDILIIPGQEVYTKYIYVQVIELYLPENATFRFIAHPYHTQEFINYVTDHSNELHGIEIGNFQHNWEMNRIDKQLIRKIAKEHDLMLLTNSDAHLLKDIGQFFNQVYLDDLYRKIEQKNKLI